MSSQGLSDLEQVESLVDEIEDNVGRTKGQEAAQPGLGDIGHEGAVRLGPEPCRRLRRGGESRQRTGQKTGQAGARKVEQRLSGVATETPHITRYAASDYCDPRHQFPCAGADPCMM